MSYLFFFDLCIFFSSLKSPLFDMAGLIHLCHNIAAANNAITNTIAYFAS